MTETYTHCPKCGHALPQALPASASCPACGIYFFKWQQPAQLASEPETRNEYAQATPSGWLAAVLQPLEKIDAISFYGRCIALGLLTLWSGFLFAYDYQDGEIGMSFMHNILLPIHEAGHVLFIPFGEFMTILGGSLFQLALPLGIGIAFFIINRDNFGAAIGLWWASVSLIDLSPYIYDALHPQLTLLGGQTGEDGPHDWIYLLGRLGQLNHAQGWGAFAHAVGGLFMVLALVWAATLLWRQPVTKPT